MVEGSRTKLHGKDELERSQLRKEVRKTDGWDSTKSLRRTMENGKTKGKEGQGKVEKGARDRIVKWERASNWGNRTEVTYG